MGFPVTIILMLKPWQHRHPKRVFGYQLRIVHRDGLRLLSLRRTLNYGPMRDLLVLP